MVDCSNDGCEARVSAEFIDTHEKQECIFRLVKCDNAGCKLKNKIQFHLLPYHKYECGVEEE